MDAGPSSRSLDATPSDARQTLVGLAYYAALGLVVAARARPDLLAELEQRVRALSGRRDWPPADKVARGKQRLREFDDEMNYAFGYADGRKDERREVEEEMAAAWAPVARKIREDAAKWMPYAERRRRELEWAKPREGDYMGRLTREQYFGADAAVPAVEGLRAA